MISVEEALARLLAPLEALPAEQVSVADAMGRVLAEDVAARRTQPPFAVSAMDGYAVRAADLGHIPVSLRIVAEIPAGAALPRLGVFAPPLRESPANVSLLLALIVAAGVQLLLFRTRLGFELRAVGLNPAAAEYGGVAAGRAQALAMALSGAVAGLGGVNFVLGYKHYFEMGFSAGAGFLGIAVALLGRNSPIGVFFAALLFGALTVGTSSRQLDPSVFDPELAGNLTYIIQGLVVLFVGADLLVLSVYRKARGR